MNTNALDQPRPSLMDYWSKCNHEGIGIQKLECCQIKSETSPIIDTPAVSEAFYDNNATSSSCNGGQACFVETGYTIPWDDSWQPELVAKHPAAVEESYALAQDQSSCSYSDLSNSYQYFQSTPDYDTSAKMAQKFTVYDLSNNNEVLPVFQTLPNPKDEFQQAILIDESSNPNPFVVFAQGTDTAPVIIDIPPEVPAPRPTRKRGRQTRDELWETIKPKGQFSCTSCDRTFKLKQHLVQHKNAKHSGPRQHRCPVCGKRFDLAENLETHQRRHKDQSKQFTCKYCPKRFNYFFDMRRHMQANHEEAPLSCSVCGKKYVRKDHLLLHENKHRKQPKQEDVKEIKTEPESPHSSILEIKEE